MRFALLGSGSSGNAVLVETPTTRVLLDAGLSARETGLRLAAIGVEPGSIAALLVTHEHQDHARGLEGLTAAFPLAVVATAGTLRGVRPWLSPGTELVVIARGGTTRIGDLQVQAFPVPHDAREPVGFRLEAGGARLAYATDLGHIGGATAEGLSQVDTLILESNYDPGMLALGPYPPRLKKRIGGRYGHLSNDEAADFLARSDLSRLRHLVLAHLSRTNNRPDLAAAVAALSLGGGAAASGHVRLRLASPDRPSPLEPVAPPLPLDLGPVAGRARPPLQLRLCFD